MCKRTPVTSKEKEIKRILLGTNLSKFYQCLALRMHTSVGQTYHIQKVQTWISFSFIPLICNWRSDQLLWSHTGLLSEMYIFASSFPCPYFIFPFSTSSMWLLILFLLFISNPQRCSHLSYVFVFSLPPVWW